MKKSIYLVAVFLLIGTAGSALAYQPRLVLDKVNIEVDNPEISKAYYSELSGDPVVYQIETNWSFNLYVGLLVPAIDSIRKDFIIEIRKNGVLLDLLDGKNYEWTDFYEPYGEDNYFQGPEFKEKVGAGSYEIEIFNTDYQGKYILVIGEKEKSSLKEAIRKIYLLPRIKSQFFDQSLLVSYFNQTGLYLLVFIPAVLIVFLLLKKIVRKLKTIGKKRKGVKI